MSAERPHYEGCGEDAASYVLGALPDDEHVAFLAHLGTCASCREEVASMQAVANSLPAAVPQLSAPAPLRDRVMSTVRTEAKLRTAQAAGGERARPRALRRRGPARLPLGVIFGSVSATAAAVLAAVLLFGGGSSHSSAKLYSADVTLPSGKATLLVNSGHGTLQISKLPQTPPGKVYEVWLKRAGAPLPTDALFTVSSAGDATVGVPGNLRGVKVVMVTAEPKGGSRAPTSTAVIVANLA